MGCVALNYIVCTIALHCIACCAECIWWCVFIRSRSWAGGPRPRHLLAPSHQSPCSNHDHHGEGDDAGYHGDILMRPSSKLSTILTFLFTIIIIKIFLTSRHCSSMSSHSMSSVWSSMKWIVDASRKPRMGAVSLMIKFETFGRRKRSWSRRWTLTRCRNKVHQKINQCHTILHPHPFWWFINCFQMWIWNISL